MYEIVGKLRCPTCKLVVNLSEKVFLDELNSITHQKCYFLNPIQLPIKDQGTFQKMILKYDFFNEYAK